MKQKMTKKDQKKFVLLLGELLNNGFSLSQALGFFQTGKLFDSKLITRVEADLSAGESLASILNQLSYSKDQLLQLELAQIHGDLPATLIGIGQQMDLLEKQRNNFIKAISYPLLLLLFLVLILLSMRFFLLPELLASGMIQQGSLAVLFIHDFPILIFVIIFCGFCFTLYFRQNRKKQSYLARYTRLSKFPLIGSLHRDYYSAYFALEWGKLFNQGLELIQIIQCLLVTDRDSLMKDLAEDLQTALNNGQSLPEQIKKYPFLTQEFSQIILQGQARGNLGKELLIYSEIIWQRLFSRIEWMISWLQPLIFLFVAVLIVSIYVAMLLPITSGLEGF
ncbi:competence type IV pilus assembly protein ComGB [Enterococcus alishanensis]|nr:competence type IV pilus assembly protein ComGB [Enterococcus alishanensis]